MKKMKKTRMLSILFLLIFGCSIFVMGVQMSTDSIKVNQTSLSPNSAIAFDSTDVWTNATNIYRGINWVNITFDNTTASNINAVGGYIATIKDKDLTVAYNITLVRIGQTNEHMGLFNPSISAKLGYYRIFIYALDLNQIPLNDDPVSGNSSWFNVLNNMPEISVELNGTQFKGGETINFEFKPSDLENPGYNLTWSANIVRSSDDTERASLFTNQRILNSKFTIPFNNTDYVPGFYYLNCSIKDVDGSVTNRHFDFQIVHNNPTIDRVEFYINGVKQSDTAPEIELFRQRDVLKVVAFAADMESNKTLTMSITANDPINWTSIGLNALNIPAIIDNDTTYFEKEISFPITPLKTNKGYTNLTVTINEDFGGSVNSVSYIKKVLIKNNAPAMPEFYINGKNDAKFAFTEKDQIEITFNATDAENDIKFFRVELHYEVDGVANLTSYSVPNAGVNTKITIRAVDLPFADYTIYAYVVDGDLAETKASMAYTVEIKPNTSQDPITWLLMVVGFILGLTLGIGLMNWRMRKSQTSKMETEIQSPAQVKAKTTKEPDLSSKTTEKVKESEKKEEAQSNVGSNKESKKKKVIRKL
jgi:hypothetical protein